MADSSDPGAISQLETQADAETSPGSQPPRLAPPSTQGESIGRYVVLEAIYERIGAPGVEASREVDAWLRTHR